MDNNENKKQNKNNGENIKKFVYDYRRNIFKNKVKKLLLKLIKK
jgi:hypothetical protein